MDARLKTPEDPRRLTREECIVETVLGIIGGATVIEDGIERQIGPHDIHGVLYHLREACLATQRMPLGGRYYECVDHAAAPRAAVEAGNAGDQATQYCATQGKPAQGRPARGHSSGTRVGPHDSSPRSLRKGTPQAQARRHQEAPRG